MQCKNHHIIESLISYYSKKHEFHKMLFNLISKVFKTLKLELKVIFFFFYK